MWKPLSKKTRTYHSLINDQRRFDKLLHHSDVTFSLQPSVVDVIVGVTPRHVVEAKSFEKVLDVALLTLLVRQAGIEDRGRTARNEVGRDRATLRGTVGIFVDHVRVLFLQKNTMFNLKIQSKRCWRPPLITCKRLPAWTLANPKDY